MAGSTCLALLTGKIHVFLQEGGRRRPPEKALEKRLPSHPLPRTQVFTDMAQVGAPHTVHRGAQPCRSAVVWLCSGVNTEK